MEYERQAKEGLGTEIAATRAPQGDPGDPSRVPGSLVSDPAGLTPTRALKEACAGLLGPEDNRPPGCR